LNENEDKKTLSNRQNPRITGDVMLLVGRNTTTLAKLVMYKP
jgi:hypothetical protein